MIEGEEIRSEVIPGKIEIDIDLFVKLIRADEKHKVMEEMQKEIDANKKAMDYWCGKCNEVTAERDALRKSLDEAKAQIAEILGIKELQQVKLAEMQFEKGVTNDADEVAS